MADYKMTLDELRNQLSGLDEYIPEDEATLRQRAVDIYSPQYQQDLQKLRDQIEFEVGRQQRSAVGQGMQRSSYNAAQEALIRKGGLQSEASLSGNYETNIAQALYNMLENEKARKQDADRYRNELLFQLYNMQPSSGSGKGKDPTQDVADLSMNSINFGVNSLLNGLRNKLTPNSGTNNRTNSGALSPGDISLTPQRDINQGVSGMSGGNRLAGSSSVARQGYTTRSPIEDANRKLRMDDLKYTVR